MDGAEGDAGSGPGRRRAILASGREGARSEHEAEQIDAAAPQAIHPEALQHRVIAQSEVEKFCVFVALRRRSGSRAGLRVRPHASV